MRRLRALLLVLGAALVLSSCTLIAPDSTPQSVSARSVPFGLLHRYVPGTDHGRVRFVTQPIYLIDIGGNLAPSSRIVPSPPTLETVIHQLLLGPSRIETAVGYHTALPSDLVLVSATLRGGVATINLATSLDKLAVRQQILAEAQLTLTARDVGATRGLTIEVAGVRQTLVLPGGSRTKIATALDFSTLNP